VRSGTAVANLEEARYAVALARESLRIRSRWSFLPPAVLAIGLLGAVVVDAASAKLAARDAAALALAALLSWAAWVLPRRRRAASAAEAANRGVLEQADQPYVPLGPASPATTPEHVLAVGYPLLFLWRAVFFGVVITVTDSRSLTVAHVWHSGWLFATLMAILDATVPRLLQSPDERIFQ
jgi:hypothetical protein